jgi:hypothetical protein
MTTRLDSRQSRQRALLDQLSNNTDVKLDTLLNLINDELTPLLRLRAANPTTLQLFVDAISIQTIDGGEGHGRTRTIQPISGVLPSFTPGNVTFPGTSGGSISATGLTLAASYTLTVTSGNWIKVGLALNSDGQVILSFGATGASESLAALPEFDTGTLPIGYVSMQNIAGTIQNVSSAKIFQFAGGGGGSGGSGSGTFKNYLESWFSGDKNVGTVTVGTVSTSGNRTAPDASWAASHSTMNIARTATSIRGKYSYLVDYSQISGHFLESPVFSIEYGDTVSSAAHLYASFLVKDANPGIKVEVVRYNSSLVYQNTIAAINNDSGRIPTSENKFFGYLSSTSASTTDKYALRIRVDNVPGSGQLTMDELYVGPNADINQQSIQRFPGVKQFADEVELREGMNVPLTLDFTGTKIIPANETTFVGKLDVAVSTTINLQSASSNLVAVGAVTGSGTISGPGILTSI